MKTFLIIGGVVVAGFVGYEVFLKPKFAASAVKKASGPTAGNKADGGGFLGSLSRTFSDFSSLSSGLSSVTNAIGGLSNDFGSFGS